MGVGKRYDRKGVRTQVRWNACTLAGLDVSEAVDRRGWDSIFTQNYCIKYTVCQFISCISFEWGGKLKKMRLPKAWKCGWRAITLAETSFVSRPSFSSMKSFPRFVNSACVAPAPKRYAIFFDSDFDTTCLVQFLSFCYCSGACQERCDELLEAEFGCGLAIITLQTAFRIGKQEAGGIIESFPH